ncbi:SMP-30/gluconolactonase/LRE family protein [Variovorax terrae]|uniref:SMP-30/gluconolactonase/LRE family protein n=1 Tax=Variovorax terrae TaxID=2923278 RepID=A0A9X1VY99_9BURK|nr:SMP-30/gluconolactonase/LRE family protein [Variovorax terrae]MCJ0765856.1 SMP-30/gluconolactonase/LRE family protein [Variovorax terrae]
MTNAWTWARRAHRPALAACLALTLGLAACSDNDAITQGAQAPAPTGTPAALAITTQPASATIGQGLAATLSVQATQATTYQWQSSADGGASWADISGATGDSYTTPANPLANSGKQFRVRVMGSSGNVTSTVATLTVKPWVASLVTTTVAPPQQLALDASGATLYVAMGNNNAVYRIDTASGSGAEVTPGQPLSVPTGLALAANGTLYVSGPHYIATVAAGATTATTWVGSGASGYADSPAVPQFNSPASIALDSAGNLFVADPQNMRVRKVAADGTVSTLAGDGTQAYADGVGTAAKMARPTGLALSRDGKTLYDTDTDSPCLRKIDVASATVSTVLGDCANGNAGAGTVDGTAATPAKLGYSYGLAVDAHNHVFLTQAWDGVARVVTAAGEISTLRDGTGTALAFNFPVGVAVAGNGTVYVGASNSKQIFKLTLAP